MGGIEPWKPEDDDPPVPRQTPNVSTCTLAMSLDDVLRGVHSSIVMCLIEHSCIPKQALDCFVGIVSAHFGNIKVEVTFTAVFSC